MKDNSDNSSIEDLDPKALDDLWIEVFGFPYRDAEQLSWVWKA